MLDIEEPVSEALDALCDVAFSLPAESKTRQKCVVAEQGLRHALSKLKVATHNNLQLQDGDTESLLHILWLRLVKVVDEYQHSYAEDVEITMIKRLSKELGEEFKIVLKDGESKVEPRQPRSAA